MSTAFRSCRAAAAPVQVRRLGTVDYEQAWALQREIATGRADGAEPDVLLLLGHPSVYTAGRRTLPAERPTDGTPVVDVDRGGKITWHVRASSWATHWCASPTRSTWSTTYGASRKP